MGGKVYCIDGDYLISAMVNEQPGYTLVHTIPGADILIFPGGSDVSPRLYGEEKHRTTYCDRATDERHKGYFERGLARDKLLVGICRGGQFLNVMSGGKMFQDVNNHALAGTHELTYADPRYALVEDGPLLDREETEWEVTSTHHQMFRSNQDTSELWGWAHRATYKDTADTSYTDPNSPELQCDEEIVWYPETKCLCFQPHPEYKSQSTRDLFFLCLDRAMKEIA